MRGRFDEAASVDQALDEIADDPSLVKLLTEMSAIELTEPLKQKLTPELIVYFLTKYVPVNHAKKIAEQYVSGGAIMFEWNASGIATKLKRLWIFFNTGRGAYALASHDDLVRISG